jgi:hypothetical protein
MRHHFLEKDLLLLSFVALSLVFALLVGSLLLAFIFYLII